MEVIKSIVIWFLSITRIRVYFTVLSAHIEFLFILRFRSRLMMILYYKICQVKVWFLANSFMGTPELSGFWNRPCRYTWLINFAFSFFEALPRIDWISSCGCKEIELRELRKEIICDAIHSLWCDYLKGHWRGDNSELRSTYGNAGRIRRWIGVGM